MARYGRRYAKRRKSYRKRPYGRKSRGLRGQVRSIARKVRNIRKTIETKFVDWYLADIDASLLGPSSYPYKADTPEHKTPFFYVSATTVGDGVSNREGRQIRATSIDINFCIKTFNVQGRIPSYRVVLIQDRFFDGNFPPSYVLWLANTSTKRAAMLSPLDWNHRKRYRIIKQKFYKLNNVMFHSTSLTEDVVKPLTSKIMKRWHIKLNKVINYSGDDATWESGGRGALFLLFINEETGENSIEVPDDILDVAWRLKFQG